MEPSLANPVNQPQSVIPQKPTGLLFIIVGLLIAFVVGAGAMYLWQNPQFLNSLPFVPQPKACTMEARLCPDSSSVGRVPPDCEFAPCPNIETIKEEVDNSDQFIINTFANKKLESIEVVKLIEKCSYEESVVYELFNPNLLDSSVTVINEKGESLFACGGGLLPPGIERDKRCDEIETCKTIWRDK